MAKDVTTLKRIGINCTGEAPAPLSSYSHAVRVGPFVFVSGQGSRDPKTGQEAGVTLDGNGKVASYDIETQTHAVIANLQSVLKAANCELTDLVDVTVFLVNMQDFSKYNSVYEKYFSFPNPPARTTVAAAALPGKNFIEIKATAFCPNGQGE